MLEHFLDNSAAAQRNRLLDALRVAPVTAIEARSNLDILMPAARVFELRDQGFDIATVWVLQETDQGKPHRVAKYILMPSGGVK